MAKLFTLRSTIKEIMTPKLTRTLTSTPPLESQQPNLLNFPIPDLDHTLDVYLKSTKPFLNPVEYEKTKTLTTMFKSTDGPILQKKLQQRFPNDENWLKDYWIKTAYLQYRQPVVVYSSTGQAFPAKQFATTMDQIGYAAKLVLAAVELSQIIREDKLPQEKMGKAPLDMSQYKSVFGGTRVPRPKCDELIVNADSRHIIVMVNNNFYSVPVLDTSRQVFSYNQIFEALKNAHCKGVVSEGAPIGGFTALPRDKWAKVYGEMEADQKYFDFFQKIKDALFVLCLDGVITPPRNDISLGTLSGLYTLTGLGAGCNRWFDKTLQLVVSANGLSGVSYEHTPGEGQTVTLLTDYIADFLGQSREKNHQRDRNDSCQPENLMFELPKKLDNMVPEVKCNLESLVNKVDFEFLHFREFGRESIKQLKMSPDSFIQIAIQLAFGRIHGEPGAQYESASLRKFRHGRTECIRSCTCEVSAFVKEMCDGDSSDKKRYAALKAAMESHKNYVNLAINGQGCDRHLLGLKLIATENKMPQHPIFEDAGFIKSSTMRLSTSQVASQALSFMCYAPLVENGYGCCYNPRKNDILFACSSFKDCPSTDAATFGKNLAQALVDMQTLILAKGSKL